MNKEIEITQDEMEEKFKIMKQEGKKKSTIKKELNITDYQYNKINKKIKEEGQCNNKKTIEQKKKPKEIKKKTNFSSAESKARYEAIDILSKKYLGYEDSKDFNSYLAKRLDAMSYEYSYEIILSTIIDCKKSMDYAIAHKEFKTDIGKISYLCAIISNNLKDTLKTKQKKELIQEGLEKRDEIDYTLLNKEKITIPTKRKDFSIFLDED